MVHKLQWIDHTSLDPRYQIFPWKQSVSISFTHLSAAIFLWMQSELLISRPTIGQMIQNEYCDGDQMVQKD
ncbi:hypothetical protein Y1Q_0005144 [Alligator mississippiensis]|uniref:Uncharacterized protein n=1 Tax=Alligator mississippiensis TaxID=8496 RepID=A0A151LY91_ALLMI|nr:hypothetical protein Y1Q_0005144 [Alligator mississippiensis]